MNTRKFLRHTFFLSTCALALMVLVPHNQPLFSQEKAPKKELSDEVNEGIQKFSKLAEENKLEEGLIELNRLIKTAGPESYDLAILSQLKAQVLARLGRQAEITQPLETALRLTKAYGYLAEKNELDLYLFLAQQYQQEATTEKTIEEKRIKLDKAIGFLREWQSKSKSATADIQLFVGSALYFRATIDERNVDAALLKDALVELDKGMLLVIKPKDSFYLLKLGIFQLLSLESIRLEDQSKKAGKLEQADKHKADADAYTKQSTEILELLVKAYPNKKDYWNTLYQTYIQGGNDVRAILVVERAQSLGLLNSPKELKTLAALYYNNNQFSHAVDIIEPGLRNNVLDSTQENWELLIACYQQLYREDKLLETLFEASKRFPEKGVFDQQIGYTYFGQEKLDKAYEYFSIALKKGGFAKPAPIYSFTAYLAYEIKKIDEALVLINEALKLDPSMKDALAMRTAIQDSINERDETLKKIQQAATKPNA